MQMMRFFGAHENRKHLGLYVAEEIYGCRSALMKFQRVTLAGHVTVITTPARDVAMAQLRLRVLINICELIKSFTE